jgi:hypothetical protein
MTFLKRPGKKTVLNFNIQNRFLLQKILLEINVNRHIGIPRFCLEDEDFHVRKARRLENLAQGIHFDGVSAHVDGTK